MFRSCAGEERRTGNLSLENVYSVGMYCAMCVRGNWGYVCQGKLGLCVRGNWAILIRVVRQMHEILECIAVCVSGETGLCGSE